MVKPLKRQLHNLKHGPPAGLGMPWLVICTEAVENPWMDTWRADTEPHGLSHRSGSHPPRWVWGHQRGYFGPESVHVQAHGGCASIEPWNH